MCVCVCVYTYKYIYTYIYIYVYMYLHNRALNSASSFSASPRTPICKEKRDYRLYNIYVYICMCI